MATLTVYNARDGRRYGVLSGGDTQDYNIGDARWFTSTDPTNPNTCGDTRSWLEQQASACGLTPHEYAYSFAHVYVADDVTKIGSFCFAYFENANFTFENPAGIAHLGRRALCSTGIRGKVSLPGLQDEVFSAAFSGCTKLEEVDLTGSAVQEIAAYALSCCYGLKKITGCQNVHTVGDGVFLRCPSLRSIDLQSNTVKSVGYAAFHIASIGTRFDHLNDTAFAETARLKDKFDAQTLGAMQAMELPDVGGLPKTVCEQNYPDLKYARLPDADQTQDYMVNGCLMFSLYHAYQRMFPDSAFDTFPAWWEHVDSLCMDAIGVHIYDMERYATGDTLKILYTVLYLLGLKPKDFSAYALHYPYVDETCGYACALMAHDETAKREIWNALASGYGVIANISAGTPLHTEPNVFFGNNHAVAIVGCRNGKLLVVDSANMDGEKGSVYEVTYEDLFMGAPYSQNYIFVIMPEGVST